MELVHQAVDDGAEQDGHHRQEGDAAGPMPVRIIEAFNTASIQGRSPYKFSASNQPPTVS